MSFRNINEEYTKRKNGYYNLNNELRMKFDLQESMRPEEKVSDYFSWEDFYEIFSKTTYLFTFRYYPHAHDENYYVEFSVFNNGKYSEFWIDGLDKETYTKYETAQELLDNVTVEGKKIQEIWSRLF